MFSMRAVPVVVAALTLGACFRDPYVSSTATEIRSGNWRIANQIDRVTGAPISSATVATMASNARVDFPQPALLQLSCFIDKPVISFHFDFKVGTNLNSFIGYRFDDKPGHEIGGTFLVGAQTVLIEEPAEVAAFVEELATSNVLFIRTRSFNAGRTAAEFKVVGAPAAIASAFATCPVRPPEAKRVATRAPSERRR